MYGPNGSHVMEPSLKTAAVRWKINITVYRMQLIMSSWDLATMKHLYQLRFPPTSLVGVTSYNLPAAVSCLCRDTAVRCSVVGPFLWPARRPGTRYQTTFEIRRVLLTVFVVTWKLFFSRSTSVHSALGASRLCAIQIYYWHWRWHWYFSFRIVQQPHKHSFHESRIFTLSHTPLSGW